MGTFFRTEKFSCKNFEKIEVKVRSEKKKKKNSKKNIFALKSFLNDFKAILRKKYFFGFFTWGKFAFEKMKNFQIFAKTKQKKGKSAFFFKSVILRGSVSRKKNDPSKTKFM